MKEEKVVFWNCMICSKMEEDKRLYSIMKFKIFYFNRLLTITVLLIFFLFYNLRNRRGKEG